MCYDLCTQALESLKGEHGTQLYSVSRVYTGLSLAVEQALDYSVHVADMEFPLYKLNADYAPW